MANRDVFIAVHLRRLVSFEVVARVNVHRVLSRHADIAAKAYREGGYDAIEVELSSREDDHLRLLVAFYPRVMDLFADETIKTIRGEQTVLYPTEWSYTIPGNSTNIVIHSTQARKPGPLDELMRDFVKKNSLKSAKRIHGTTKKDIKAIIDKGVRLGHSTDKIAKAIQKKAKGLALHRARDIARTETHNAATFAAQEAAKSEDAQMYKEWVTILDGHARESHEEMDGVTIHINEYYEVPPFGKVPGAYMMRPGDMTAPAGQIINCRCGEIYHTVEE